MGSPAFSKGTTPALLSVQTQDNPRAVVAPSNASLNVYQKQRLQRYLAGFAAPLDTLRVIALQVQFADSVMGGQPGSERDALRDSTWFANEMRHLEQYYRGASRSRTAVAWRIPTGAGKRGLTRVSSGAVTSMSSKRPALSGTRGSWV